MARSESETQTAVRPYFGHLPDWIYVNPAYTSREQCVEDRLTNNDRWVLHIIAGQCGTKVDDNGSTRGCWCGERLLQRTHCFRSTFWDTMKKLHRLGFVVKLTQGGGHGKANELGIPGQAGALNALSMPEDPRYRKPRRTVQNPDGIERPKKQRTVQDSDGSSDCVENQTVPMSDGKPSRCPTVNRPDSGPEPSRIRTQSSSSSYDYPEDHLCDSDRSVMLMNNGDARDGRNPELSERHDDDLKLLESKLRIELPDSADRDRMKKALLDAGEDDGRAHQHAHHPLVEPGTIREALALLTTYTARKPGAYLGRLMDDRITKAKEVEAQRRQQASEAVQFRVREAEALIEGLSDAELEEVIGSVGWAKGMNASKLRSDPVLRKHLAETMAGRLESEASDDDAVTSMGGG